MLKGVLYSEEKEIELPSWKYMKVQNHYKSRYTKTWSVCKPSNHHDKFKWKKQTRDIQTQENYQNDKNKTLPPNYKL
jgi:hypothetical protein